MSAGLRAEAPTWFGVVGTADEIDAAAIVIGLRGSPGCAACSKGSSRTTSQNTRGGLCSSSRLGVGAEPGPGT
jgi:hypothetical protein